MTISHSGSRFRWASSIASEDAGLPRWTAAAQQGAALLVRNGKGGRRREIGMDAWGWEQLRPWLTARVELPVGSMFCLIDGPTRGRPWSSAAVRSELVAMSGAF